MLDIEQLTARMDLEQCHVEGQSTKECLLSQLAGSFADPAAYEQALAQGDRVVYRTSYLGPAQGPGDLHCALAQVLPGRVGGEYHLTRGHFHQRAEAAELYIGLRGSGYLLLEDAQGKNVRLLELQRDSLVYVPGHMAHRTINTSDEPLVYLGVFAADAGQDYGAIAQRNFSHILVATVQGPQLIARTDYLK